MCVEEEEGERMLVMLKEKVGFCFVLQNMKKRDVVDTTKNNKLENQECFCFYCKVF